MSEWNPFPSLRVALVLALALAPGLRAQSFQPVPAIHNVFLIVLENMNWSQVKGNADAPYINNVLLPKASHAEQYFGQPGLHPSLPNYLWLEAGSNFGIESDPYPSTASQSTTAHLTTEIQNAGLSWKAYVETVPGGTCPLADDWPYTVLVNPTMYFNDVTGNGDPNNASCIAHEVPFANLATDLSNNQVPNLNWLILNLCDDGHSCPMSTADTFLQNTVGMIEASKAYQQGGAIFITWDETDQDLGNQIVPIGMIVDSPAAKGGGYSNTINYTHASLLRTICEIFGIDPPGGAAASNDLSDLFTTAGGGAPVSGAGFNPSGLTFAAQAVGTASAYQVVTLTSNGTATLNLNSLAISPSFTQYNDCPDSGVMPAGTLCTFHINFKPSAPGAVTGAMTLGDDAPGSPQIVTLSGGTGGAPVAGAAFNPASVNFGAQATGTTSAYQVVTLTSSGQATLNLNALSISAGFTQYNDCPDSGVMPAGTTCTFHINFRPSASGAVSGLLTLGDNAPGSPQTLGLTGTGGGAASGARFSATALTFGPQAAGTASAYQAVTLTSSGQATLNLTSLAISAGFSQYNDCPDSGVMAVGTTCTFYIRFAPGAGGPVSGVMTLGDDAPGSPQIITLTGALAAGAPGSNLRE